MRKTIPLAASCILALALNAQATTTFQFSNSFLEGIASNFANNGATSGTDGMIWGIVVDNNNDGFQQSNYLGGFTANNNNTAISLSTNGGVTDDILYLSGALTSDTSTEFEGDISTLGNNGSIINFNSFDFTGVDQNDSFGLIWFDSSDIANGEQVIAGDHYGFFTDAAFTLPADSGGTESFASVFAGVDPVRTANLQFAASAVPEPSSTALLGLGSLGLLLRRRR